MEVGRHGLLQHARELLGGPALAVVDGAEDARLGEEVDLLAPHPEDLAGDVLGLVRGEESSQRGHVGRGHLLDLLHLLGLLRVVGGDGGDEPGPGEGGDAVGGHVIALEVQGADAGERHDAELGRGVVGLAHVADEPGGGGEVDEPSGFLLPKVHGRGPRAVE